MQKITQLTFGNCIVFGIGFNCLTVHNPRRSVAYQGLLSRIKKMAKKIKGY